jgi:hypothetical protein
MNLHRGFVLLLLSVLTSAAHADVGVSVTVGEPGFYGRIDIGDYPRPRLIYAEPLIVDTVHVVREPAYLHVPPGHAKKWNKHCHRYNACARPVYFVEDDWYEAVYVPAYQQRHGKGKGKGKGKHHPGKHDGHPGKGKGRDKD